MFVDETGTTTKMTRLRGRARRGERLKARAPFGHWATQTFIAGLRCAGLTAPWRIERPMNRQIFATWAETQLAPTLQSGDVVILDNLSRHKSPKAAAILKERGAWFLFLPAYSPDPNPIKTAFAKRKAHLRRIGARTIDALWRAVGHICALFSPDECWNTSRQPDMRQIRRSTLRDYSLHRRALQEPPVAVSQKGHLQIVARGGNRRG